MTPTAADWHDGQINVVNTLSSSSLRERNCAHAAFSVAGVPIAVDSALVEGGIDWRLTSQIKLGVGYQGELAKHAQTQMAKGNFTWNF